MAEIGMRMVVFGGRSFGKTWRQAQFITRCLNQVYEARHPRVVIVGRAKGVETVAEEWAKTHRLEIDPYPADWDNTTRPGAIVRYHPGGKAYDAMAGPIRNQKMVDAGMPSFGVRFPGGTGTADMARRLVTAHIEIIDFTNGWPP